MSGLSPVRWALFHTNRGAWDAAKAMLEEAQQSIAIPLSLAVAMPLESYEL